MSLGWMFYLADIVDNVSTFFCIVSSILFIVLSFILLSTIAEEMSFPKWLFLVIPCSLCLTILIAILIPSRSTIYAFGAQYAIEDIAAMPETKQLRETLNKFLEVVDSKLDEELKQNGQ